MTKKDGRQRPKPTVQDDLEQYQERKQLIASHKAELAGDLTVADTVVGSMAEFPYTEQTVTIIGINERRAQTLRERIYDLEEQCTRAEAYVACVADEHMRSLLYWHYLRGQSWPKVRKTMGMREVTTGALRTKVYYFFQKVVDV